MQPTSRIDAADRLSRKRAIGAAIAALVFVAIQLIAPPFFVDKRESLRDSQALLWLVNALILLALLATGGGLVYNREVRRLLNDEVSRSHYRSAVMCGFWIAMAAAVVLFVVPALAAFTAREAAYLLLTPSIAGALLAFAFLELRSHRDA